MCEQNFFRRWSVEYLDEPRFSGEMEITRNGSDIFVSGSINLDGVPNGSYTASDAVCVGSLSSMRFTYRLSSGDTGRLSLSLSGNNTNLLAEGTYVDNGPGGDEGRIRLRPIILNADDIANNFTFENTITPAQRDKLIERHRFAYSRITACSTLSDEQKTALMLTYGRSINHGIDDRPGVNASAFLGGSQIFVNFDNLFPQGDREIAQTLIHEMMHCAGYTHPTRRDGIDIPGDEGVYYGTPPLQSEICIAGVQSDAVCFEDARGRCVLSQIVRDENSPLTGFARVKGEKTEEKAY